MYTHYLDLDFPILPIFLLVVYWSDRQDAGLWALGGSTFRNLVRESAERHQAENLQLLERIHILDGLSNVQKVNVGAVPGTNEPQKTNEKTKSMGKKRTHRIFVWHVFFVFVERYVTIRVAGKELITIILKLYSCLRMKP